MAYNGHPPFQKHSATSKAAADKAAPRAGSDKARVLEFIRDHGEHGATSEEVQIALGLSHQTGSARVSDLLQDGLIVESGRTRTTTKGCEADVLVVAPPGTPPRSPKSRRNPEGFTKNELVSLYGDFRALCVLAAASGGKLSPLVIKLGQWLQAQAGLVAHVQVHRISGCLLSGSSSSLEYRVRVRAYGSGRGRTRAPSLARRDRSSQERGPERLRSWQSRSDNATRARIAPRTVRRRDGRCL